MGSHNFKRVVCRLTLFLALLISSLAVAQDETTSVYNPEVSIARNWNEALLFAIRRDFARPVVHARNLFHASAMMYDSWALYANTPALYFLGRTQAPDNTILNACVFPQHVRQTWQNLSATQLDVARQTTLSFAMYRLLRARFTNSPGAADSLRRVETLFLALGLDSRIDSTDISSGTDPARLGNYLARCVIDYGLTDGSNEINNYANSHYTSINPPLSPYVSGNPGLNDPNRWQSLQLDIFVDQSGNETPVPFFLGAEWSDVEPFALTDSDITPVSRDNTLYSAYLDPGQPAWLGDDPDGNRQYQQGFALVALWSSHLDPADGVSWDISPGNLGNAGDLPSERASLLSFYNALEGGTQELGYATNPFTGAPYVEVRVPRGDFTRVVAEFWADGPDSETPPGHWFQIYNTLVSDHPEFTRRIGGIGDEITALDFDIRAYFTLGAAMHDSAIAAWSVKGAYDYIRPISALRYMAALGQSTDMLASNYHVHGVPLQEGFIETIRSGDPLAGSDGRNVDRIKVRAWRGPDFIADPQIDVAGVGWILLENWWPYQRPSFVTPPFAGYVSGHSTFSRAAADILSALTGSEYFPGGLAEFTAKKNEFLVFEEGPSVDVTLQWARYRDASDQTSLSRIWGGIHPPVDDIPGRLIGSQVAARVLTQAQLFFDGQIDHTPTVDDNLLTDNGSGGGCSIGAYSQIRSDEVLWLMLIACVLKITSHRRNGYRIAPRADELA